jgi:hypothetical protein
MTDELESIWKKAVVPYLRSCPNFSLEILEKATTILCQNSQCPSRCSKGRFLDSGPNPNFIDIW